MLFLVLWKIQIQKTQCHQYFQILTSLLDYMVLRLATGLVYLTKLSPKNNYQNSQPQVCQEAIANRKKLDSLDNAKYNFDGRTKIYFYENVSPAN